MPSRAEDAADELFLFVIGNPSNRRVFWTALS